MIYYALTLSFLCCCVMGKDNCDSDDDNITTRGEGSGFNDSTCFLNEEQSYQLAGTNAMQYGYNLITGESSRRTGHSGILDTFTSSTYNFRIRMQGKCYIVPDAYLTLTSRGFEIRSYSNKEMATETSATSGEWRDNLKTKYSSDLALDVTGFSILSLGAAYASSQEVTRSRDLLENAAMDYSETEYEMILYSLQIQRPVPTPQIVHFWKKMYEEYKKEESSSIFTGYFDTFGTHYHISANIGGKWNVYFTTKSTSVALSKSTTSGRTKCIESKLSTAYFSSVAPSVNAKHCSDNFGENAANYTVENLVSSSGSSCVGAAFICPQGPGLDRDPADALKNWKEQVPNDPSLLNGSKRW